jgi:hypothetical protein
MNSRTLTVISRNSGFFSNFNCVLNNIERYLGKDGILAAEVVWRVRDDLEQFSYGQAGDGNIWLHFFEPLPFSELPPERLEVCEYPETGACHVTGKDVYATYRLNSRWRKKYNALFGRFVRIRSFLAERADAIFTSRMAGRCCVGVHYRNPRHAVECLRPIPPPEVFIDRVRKLLPAGRTAAVVLASDFEPAVDAFRVAFGELLVIQPEVTRVTSLERNQLHHVAAHQSLALGEQVLVDCLLLARCDVLLHVTSNVATTAGYINPELRMVYCETRAEAWLGTLWAVGRVIDWRFGPAWRAHSKWLRPTAYWIGVSKRVKKWWASRGVY